MIFAVVSKRLGQVTACAFPPALRIQLISVAAFYAFWLEEKQNGRQAPAYFLLIVFVEDAV